MTHHKPDKRYRSLSLANISFAFFLLGPGFGLATLAFIVELLIYYKQTKTINLKASNPLIKKLPAKYKASALKEAAKVVIAVARSQKRQIKLNKTPTADIPVVTVLA